MSSPFKVGDKVVCVKTWDDNIEKVGEVYTVAEAVMGAGEVTRHTQYLILKELQREWPHHKFNAGRYRAAIAGQDYRPVTSAEQKQANDLYPSGHLADGSSVQKHSAGELYPYVIAYRDNTDKHSQRKYDAGLIGPRIVGTAWFTSFEDAVAAAIALKK